MPNISVILPVFNERKSLFYVIAAWSKFFKEKNIVHEFVICEDGSTDGTKELIKEMSLIFPISSQSSEMRTGYGGGVIRGIKTSKFEHILCIDSDGQCMPDSFINFYNSFNAEVDILIGNRNPRNDPLIRIFYSKLFKIIHDILFNSNIKDPSCPYVLAKKQTYFKLLDKLEYLKEGFWWGFTGAAKMSGLKINQIDIIHYKRYDGSTVVYKLSKMPMIIIKNIIGLIKLKKSFNSR
jgi:glycosyltransferase involved in cell wall biosynthesis